MFSPLQPRWRDTRYWPPEKSMVPSSLIHRLKMSFVLSEWGRFGSWLKVCSAIWCTFQILSPAFQCLPWLSRRFGATAGCDVARLLHFQDQRDQESKESFYFWSSLILLSNKISLRRTETVPDTETFQCQAMNSTSCTDDQRDSLCHRWVNLSDESSPWMCCICNKAP